MHYRDEIEEKNKEKLDELLNELPAYCRSFFISAAGTSDRPSSTLLAYAREIRFFYQYLIDNNPLLKCYSDITMDVLNMITPKDIQEYIYHVKQYKNKDGKTVTNSANTRARKLSALRSFFKYLYTYDDLHTNPAAMVDLPRPKEKHHARLNKPEVSKLIDSVESGAALAPKKQNYVLRSTLRDTAIVKLFLGTGIRVSELVGIDLDHIDWDNKEILIVRKGGDENTIFISDEIATALEDYIRFERKPLVDTERALFVSSRTSSRGRLGVRAVEKLIKKYSEAVIVTKKITPHSLRGSFGTNFYQESGDIYETADLMGHKSPTTTAKAYSDIDKLKEASAVREFADNFVRSK